MIVEDKLDRSVRRIRSIKSLEKADEFARAMTILDTGMYFAGQQIDAGEQAQRAVALIFVVAREARVTPRLRRKVGRVLPIAWIPGFSSYEMIATLGSAFWCARSTSTSR